MKKRREKLWTWLLPEGGAPPPEINERQWQRHGGKWIIFGRKKSILALAARLGPFIDAGDVPSAKYWNEDPSALCVYSLDADSGRTLELLKGLGPVGSRVWEYDYAWDKNIKRPLDFLYSQFSKMSTILRSYGIRGSLKLMREILKGE